MTSLILLCALSALHFTAVLLTLDYDLYFLFRAFRHNTGKLMAKQAIFVFGFITVAVFIQIKGNSFKKLFLSQS